MTILKYVATICLMVIAPIVIADESANNSPITVYIAKKIITMDGAWPEATAVAVRDGKILSVGSLDDLKPWLSKYPSTIDKTFADKILMPGFIEPHGHPLIGGTAMSLPLVSYLPIPNPYGPAFPGVKTKADAMAMLRSYLQRTPAGKPLVSWGYDSIAMGSPLDATELDQISSTVPILVWDASEHTVYTNSATLKKYQVKNTTPKMNGLMLDKNGQPNGQFYGVTAASYMLKKVLPDVLTADSAYNNVKFLMDLSHQNGITTTTELAFGIIDFPVEQATYNKYFNDPNTPMRIMIVTDAVSAKAYKGANAVAFVKDLEEKQSNDKLMYNGVKFFSDDAFLSLNMVVENPGYTDGHHGLYITPPDQLAAAIAPWWDAGFHIHVHSNGNGGNASTINALFQLMQRKPRFDHRFSIEHFGISTPAMAREIKQLGGVVSANPSYVYARSDLNRPFLGTDRADTAAAFNTLLKAGVPTSLHSDTPVSPPLPLKEVWMVVNRLGLEGTTVHAPAERVTVEQALRMITIDAAYTIGEDTKIGSITPGKFADFTVLETDPYSVPPEAIKDIKVWGTVVGGKVYPLKASG